MRKTAMQEHVGQKLVDVELACQEKVETKQTVQVYPTALQHPRSGISQNINDQQILGHCWYIVHILFDDLTINDLTFIP
jgi:hypothetical protein